MKSIYPATAFVCFFLFALLCYPKAMLDASASSANLWFSTVLPSLFPFLTAAGILFRLGAAEKMGRLLQPVMKPIFRLSGICAFPLFLGLLSGYPMGAKMTALLYEERKITKAEAQKVLAFCNCPGALFLIGTVGTGFFGSPAWGYAFFTCAILGTLLTGILVRFLPSPSIPATSFSSQTKKEGFSSLFSSAISDALTTVVQIGGYIIFFGVLTESFRQTGVFALLGRFLHILPVSSDFIAAIGSGLMEMTNGAHLLSQAPDSAKLCLTSALFLVSFGGISILGQTLDILRSVPISSAKYVLSKLCNALCSCLVFLLTFPFWENIAAKQALPVLSLQSTACTETAYLPVFVLLGIFLLSAAIKRKA